MTGKPMRNAHANASSAVVTFALSYTSWGMPVAW